MMKSISRERAGLNFIKNLDELNINRPENILKTPIKELLKNSNEIYKANNQLNDLQKDIRRITDKVFRQSVCLTDILFA